MPVLQQEQTLSVTELNALLAGLVALKKGRRGVRLPLDWVGVAGKVADDPLSLPAVRQVSQSLQMHGLLYIGDCKMAALLTRAFLHAQGDYYLCPLASQQVPDAVLDAYLQPVWAGERTLTPVYRSKPGEEPELIAQGYEQTVIQTGEVDGQPTSWGERLLIDSQSPALGGEWNGPGHPSFVKVGDGLYAMYLHVWRNGTYYGKDGDQRKAIQRHVSFRDLEGRPCEPFVVEERFTG